MKTQQEITQYNKKAWDREVTLGNKWTIPVSPAEIAVARTGSFSILLTPLKPVPKDWFPNMQDCQVLCLASGGGQQGPLLAAAGAKVTVLDNSPAQLQRDRLVAEREGLSIRLVEGIMTDLSAFDDASLDLIIHPVSNCFTPYIRPVWQEAFRVLRAGGTLLSGFHNPDQYCLDDDLLEEGILQLTYRLPYSDLTSISKEERLRKYKDEPVVFSHSLEEQIGGQIETGFHIVGFYEDIRPEDPVSEFFPTFAATRALKPEN